MLAFLKSKKKEGTGLDRLPPWLLPAAALLGICLLLLGGNAARSTEPTKTEELYSPSTDEALLYQAYLEERVERICRSVSGIGSVTVIVTLSGGYESVYATELTEKGEEYVIVGNGSSAEALLLSRKAPGIVGIGVVCHGSASAAARHELISLLSAGLGVPSNRIYVTS